MTWPSTFEFCSLITDFDCWPIETRRGMKRLQRNLRLFTFSPWTAKYGNHLWVWALTLERGREDGKVRESFDLSGWIPDLWHDLLSLIFDSDLWYWPLMSGEGNWERKVRKQPLTFYIWPLTFYCCLLPVDLWLFSLTFYLRPWLLTWFLKDGHLYLNFHIWPLIPDRWCMIFNVWPLILFTSDLSPLTPE